MQLTPETARQFDRLQIIRVAGTGAATRLPASSAWPYVAVYAAAGTTEAVAGDASLVLETGAVGVLRAATDLRITCEAGADATVIRIPDATVGSLGSVLGAAHGRSWSTRQGTASLVGHVLDAIVGQPHDYSPATPGRLAEHVIGLIGVMCADDVEADRGSRASLLQRAKDYVELHLADPTLSPVDVARSQSVSTRTLHRLFEADGQTIASWIRGRRLERCRVELTDAGYDDVPVSAIGARWGLCDAAHFSRLFKATFGRSPREYRVTHRGHRCDGRCATELLQVSA